MNQFLKISERKLKTNPIILIVSRYRKIIKTLKNIILKLKTKLRVIKTPYTKLIKIKFLNVQKENL